MIGHTVNPITVVNLLLIAQFKLYYYCNWCMIKVFNYRYIISPLYYRSVSAAISGPTAPNQPPSASLTSPSRPAPPLPHSATIFKVTRLHTSAFDWPIAYTPIDVALTNGGSAIDYPCCFIFPGMPQLFRQRTSFSTRLTCCFHTNGSSFKSN